MSWHNPGTKEYAMAILCLVLAALFMIYRIAAVLLTNEP